MGISSQEIYKSVFNEYPDVLDVEQVSAALDVSRKTIYKLINDGSLQSLKVGREYRIPKIMLLQYINLITVS